MKFYIYATDMESDVLHSLTCYLITQRGRHKISNERKCLFPCFKNLQKGETLDRVHKAMESYIENVPGVNVELKPYGIRVSAAYPMSHHPILNISAETVHVGWSFEGK